MAKPAYPVWEDAARLVDGRSPETPTAQRRTAYQNPPAPLNLRGLSEGFREGTRPLTEAGQQAGQWIDSQARGLAEGTRQLVDQTGENLRRGTQNVLNGTADTLERVLPGSTNPYADRTQYNANDYDSGNGFNRQPPPLPSESQFASPGTDYRDTQLREAQARAEQQRLDEQERARRQYEADTLAAEQRAYQQQLGRERASRRNPVSNSGLAEPFADNASRYAEPRTQLSPVRRNEQTPVANDRDPWRPFDDGPVVGDYSSSDARDEGNSVDGFPALNPPQNGWNDSLARGQSPNVAPGFNQQPYTPPYSAAGAAPQAPVNAAPVSNSTNPTGWNGQVGGQQPTGSNGSFVEASTAGEVTGRDSGSINLDRFLLVVLGAASCFTWLAYYDVRQKYRLALRSVPVNELRGHAA